MSTPLRSTSRTRARGLVACAAVTACGLAGVGTSVLAPTAAAAPVRTGAVTSVLAPTAAAAPVRTGITSMSPAQALAAAAAALRLQPNLVLTGELTEDGSTISISTEASGKGRSSAGTLVSSSATIGFYGKLEFVALPSAAYLKGGKNFWRSVLAKESATKAETAALLKGLTDTWIKVPAAEAASFTGGLGPLVQPSKLATELTTDNGTLKEGAPKVVNGQPALPITSSKGGTIWLALKGAPLPLKVTANGSATLGTGSISFAYPAKLSITVPKGAKSISQLGL